VTQVIGNVANQYSAYDFLFAFSRNCVSILYCYREIVIELFVKGCRFLPTPPAFGDFIRVIPFEFCQGLWHQETRVPGLSYRHSCGVVCVSPLYPFQTLSIEHRLVTDRQTDIGL